MPLIAPPATIAMTANAGLVIRAVRALVKSWIPRRVHALPNPTVHLVPIVPNVVKDNTATEASATGAI